MALGWRGSYTRYKEFFLNISALYKKRADLRAFLEIILSLSTIIIFLVFALKPTAITIIDLLQQIKERKATLSALTQKVSDLQTADSLLQQNQNLIAYIDTAVPTLPNPGILSGQVLGLSAKNSTDILGFSVNQISLMGADANIKEMPFSVSVSGTFPNLTAFIKDFENLRISTKIATLAINSSVTEKGLVTVAVISGGVPFLGK